MKNDFRSICNIPFLVCLITLLLNDFYFKSQYHNWITGKLSDVCGLFVFASFWTAVFPSKKQIIYFSTALLFVIWKSPYSQVFINFFSHNFYPIYRVVDVTDLIALVILPVIYFLPSSGRLQLNPVPLLLLSAISFCATSVPRPTQTFAQPQYLLFKSGIVKIAASDHPNDYDVYDLDSVIVVNIREIRIEKRASLDDDFHKTQILKEIDLRLLRELNEDSFLDSQLNEYRDLKNSLITTENTSVILKLDSITDWLSFKETRLHGEFKRFSKNDQILIEGRFKDGIEDSVWKFYNNRNELMLKKYFKNGELTKTELFENLRLATIERHDTRDQTIGFKYFHLSMIGVLILFLGTRLILNYKKSTQKDVIQLSDFYRIVGIIILPIIVFILAKLISLIIPNSYSNFFGAFFELILAGVIGAFLFFFVFYLLMLRSKLDLLFYILMFALIIVFVEEWIYLGSLQY